MGVFITYLPTLIFLQIGALSNGLLDLGDIKNKLLDWKAQKLNAFCPSNA